MNPRNILYVFCSQNYSGAEIVLRRLIQSNADKVNPFVLCPPGEFADSIKKEKIALIEEPHLASLQRRSHAYSLLKLIKILLVKIFFITKNIIYLSRKHNLYAIHSNNLAASVYLIPSLIILKLLKPNIKWLWSNHDLSYPHRRSSRILAKICHGCYDKTLAVSQAVKSSFPKYKNKIEVLYNGLNVEIFSYNEVLRKKFRTEYNIREPAILIGIVGVIYEGKGHHLLIEAFRKLLETFSNIYLFVIGKFSPEEKNYEDKIRQEIASIPFERAILTGPQQNMPQVYSGLDILVNATTQKTSESLGTTIYEAMACQRIVAASHTGGSPEIIDNNKNGFLFNPDSVKSLTETLSYILNNFDSLNDIRQKARDKVLMQFDINRMVINYNQILDAFEN